MKLDAISIKNQPPLKCFDADGFSSLVVIAGPNGVGKTQLLNAILAVMRNPSGNPANARIVASATNDRERQEWGMDRIDTSVPEQARRLTAMLQRRQRRGHWQSSAFHFDSSRQFANIQQIRWDWNFVDPTEEEVGWDFLFNPFAGRFQDTIHAIYRMLGHHRTSIARRAIELQREGCREMPLDFPDPLERFKTAFSTLLGPKVLADIDITSPEIRYIDDGATLNIDRLSSGEKEAFNIVFDLLLRQPDDCVIFFDEPELHLHPELSFRLLKTLQLVGSRNQFFFFTHSADIISSAIEHSVIFIAPKSDATNQAVPVNVSDDTVTALQHLGQGLGVISLGRRIVLIEGSDNSVDKESYGALVQDRCPSLVLAPSGSRGTILSFSEVVQNVLHKTLWGVEFFMLADRDNSLPNSYLAELEHRSSGRLRFLPRIHVENYFLDETVIAEAFNDLVPVGDWRRSPDAILECLMTIARSSIPIAVNQWLGTQLRSLVGELDVSVKGADKLNRDDLLEAAIRVGETEMTRVTGHMGRDALSREFRKRWDELESSLSDQDHWKALFPGKLLFAQLAARCDIKPGMLRSAYLSVSRRRSHAPFQDIVTILEGWSRAQSMGQS